MNTPSDRGPGECPHCGGTRRAKPIYFDGAKLTEAEKAALVEACGGEYVLLSGPAFNDPWQPISRAPKDGTSIDVWNGVRWPDSCWRIPDYGNTSAPKWCRFDFHDTYDVWYWDEIKPQPSHFMVRPAPPRPTQEIPGD